MKRKKISDLQPGDTVKTPGQGVFQIIKLIRVFNTKSGKVYNYLTNSRGGRLAGRGDLTVEVIE